jgi:hypothetical protein
VDPRGVAAAQRGLASGAADTIASNTTDTVRVTGSGATGNRTGGNIIGP